MKSITKLTDEEYVCLRAKHEHLKKSVHDYEEAHKAEIEAECEARKEKWLEGHPNLFGYPWAPWWFDEMTRRNGYAHYNFAGTVSHRLSEALGRNPDSDEIIMLVDGGFSHFGASCSLGRDGHFTGSVNTD